LVSPPKEKTQAEGLFKNTMLKKISENESEKLKTWKKLNNEMFQIGTVHQILLRARKSRRISLAVHVARMKVKTMSRNIVLK
jgi:hypothetical protein